MLADTCLQNLTMYLIAFSALRAYAVSSRSILLASAVLVFSLAPCAADLVRSPVAL